MKSGFRAVLFDLDGTLADTLADLANAVNHALITLDCPTHLLSAYRYFVGDGARNLILRALPSDKASLVDKGLALMRAHYYAHCFYKTRLYPGIPELVANLHKRGLKLAVFSNKPDVFTKRMVAHFFGGDCSREPARGDVSPPAASRLAATVGPFDAVQGHEAPWPIKPDPTVALEIAKELDVPVAEWIYLGDTNTDMWTARAAGMFAVGALWGFRDQEELLGDGAQHLVANPQELLHLL